MSLLDTLHYDHLTHEHAAYLRRLVGHLRAWRTTDCSFLLVSEQKGVGKTHIARAVYESFATVMTSDLHGEQLVDAITTQSRENMALFWTATEAMDALHDTPAREAVRASVPAVILDDIGREGNLKYVAADRQEATIQARYFDIVDRCDKAGIRLFITSNAPMRDLKSGRGPFNAATWSRLTALCTRRYMIAMPSDMVDYRAVVGGFE